MAPRATTNPETIRDWAESWGARPAAVRATHDRNQIGIIRLMFPNSPYNDRHDLVPISWDEFFVQFEDSDLAFVFEDDSGFNKLVSRDSLEDRGHGHRRDSGSVDGGRDDRRDDHRQRR